MTFNEVTNSLTSVIVNNQLQLDNGIIRMGIANPLTNILLDVTNSNPSTTTGAVINFLATGGSSGTSWVHGRIRRAINNGSANTYYYPVGDATRYELAKLDLTANNASTITGYFDSNSATGIPALVEAGYTYNAVCPNGFWNLTPNLFSVGSYDLELFPVDITCTGQRPTFAKSPNGAGAWTFDGSTYVNATKRTGFTSFSDFALIMTPTILPVTWVSFTGKTVKQENTLTWKTSSELNAAYFDVERSNNGIDFMKIGQVMAHGNSNTLKSYSFIDKKPFALSYYRLAQKDTDTKVNYSVIIALKTDNSLQEVELYPNPANEVVTVQFSDSETETVNIQIFDVLGREIVLHKTTKEGYHVQISTSQLQQGVYQLVISTATKQHKLKLQVTRN
jgi:hypothetical protein